MRILSMISMRDRRLAIICMKSRRWSLWALCQLREACPSQPLPTILAKSFNQLSNSQMHPPLSLLHSAAVSSAVKRMVERRRLQELLPPISNTVTVAVVEI
jgi:hypothetical protein